MFVFALTLGGTPQNAEAGKACNKLNLNSPCIRSGDMKPNLKLGRKGNDGDLIVQDSSKANSVHIDGDNSTVTNTLTGNGLVKAWAKINADGTIDSCWRCNTDPAETRRAGKPGTYEVDFTPLSTDISGRPRSIVLDQKFEVLSGGETEMSDRSGDVSSVLGRTYESGGTPTDKPFTVIIY